jgi:NAD(P)H-dependent flavin oxidoreductase YrpB (nitropropane dioxygenase family)
MGPFSTAALAAAVSNAGGLGTVSIPALGVPFDEARKLMRVQIEAAAAATNHGFAVNIPIGVGPTGEELPPIAGYLRAVVEARGDPDIGSRLVACITSAGLPPPSLVAAFHEAGLVHLHKVGAVRHARKAAQAGVDAIIASGAEMGGHTHNRPVHTMVLAPQVIDSVDVPVIVAGGIFDHRGLAAALAMGGCGVAMGTRFIATEENDWHPGYKRAIVAAEEWGDVVLPGFYGPLRGLDNRGARRLLELVAAGAMDEEALASWKEERVVAAQRDGDTDAGLIIAGQCAAAITEVVSVADLLPDMVRRAAELLREANRMSESLPAVGRLA